MSLSFINSFQNKIYDALKNAQIFKDAGMGIYISAQQDTKCPFIIINILKVQNLSISAVENYEIDFQISIFTKEKKQDFLFKMLEKIADLMIPANLHTLSYNIIGTRFSDIEFTSGHDNITKKITLNYKSLIRVS